MLNHSLYVCCSSKSLNASKYFRDIKLTHFLDAFKSNVLLTCPLGLDLNPSIIQWALMGPIYEKIIVKGPKHTIEIS